MHTSRATARKPSLASLRRKSLPLSLSLLLCGALAVTPAQAGSVGRTTTPTGGSIVGGSGSIVQDGASVVINQASQKLALDWQSFNLGQDATVRFNQPGASAVALNRILDQNPSQIFGQVSSNGQVFLINTHGIIFGATAQVNVGGLVASTLDLTPTDFLSNHFNLDKVGGGAGIVNHGTIAAASGGSVSLIGGSVHNDGVILANYGRINLDGADHAVLDFDGNGLINVQITGELKQRLDAKAAVDNAGALHADGGTVVLEASAARDLFTSLVNNSGVIDAGAISQDGGVVRLVARGGDVIDDGRIDATGVHGGSVQLLSDRNVGVTGGRIDASGASGGGHIRVGGGWQGGEGLQTAEAVYVAADATLKADATHKGDGGSVVVWGNRTNNFYGAISARGGAAGGDGGRVETSAHDGLNAQGRVDASAPAGHAGTWLLDPHDVRIVSGTAGDPLSGTSPDAYFSAAADDSQIGADVIGSALDDGTNVSVFTGADGTQAGDITVEAPVTAAGAGSLYLKAAGSIFLDADIAGNGTDPLGVHLWANYGGAADDTTYVGRAVCANCEVVVGHTAGASITTGGGVLDIRTGDALHAGGTVTFGNGSATGSIESGAFTVQATGITIDGASYTFDTGDTTLDAGEGDVTLAGDLNFGGDLTVTGDQITLGNGPDFGITAESQSYNGAVVLGGNATLTATSGAVSLAGGVDGGGSNLAIDGDAVLGSASGVGTLSVSGASTLNGNLTTLGSQTYDGAVTLGGDAVLASSGNADIGFGSTVDGAHALAVNTGAATSFGGAVGATTALTSLTIDTGGSTSLGGDVHTTGAQSYHDALTLAGDATLTSTGNAGITFGSTVDGAHALTVNTGGATGFGGAIGATTALTSLTTDAPGTLTLGGNVTTSGAQSYGEALTLTANQTFTSTGNGDITFGSTVDGAYALTVNTGGATGFGGAIGATTALTSLTTDAPGTLALGGNVTTSGAQSYGEAIALTADRTFTSTGSADISFGSTVDGAHALTVNTGGATVFGGAVGATAALTSLTTDTGGSTSLGGNVRTSGAQTYHDALTLAGDATLASTGNADIVFGSTIDGAHALVVNTGGITGFGGAIGAGTALASLTTDATGSTALGGDVKTTGAQTYNDTVNLSGDAVLTSSGNADIVFARTVDGAHALGVNTGGDTRFGGAVGSGTALASLATDAPGTLTLGGNVTSSGAQSYGEAVMLTADRTFTSTGSGDITFGSSVDGAHALVVNTGGITRFGGAVGAGTALSGLTTDAGGSTSLGGDVTTTGVQSYGDAVRLESDATLASTAGGDITFDSTVDGAYALLVNTAGSTRFGGAVGATTALTSLATDAPGVTVLGGDITTHDTQTYGDAVTLDADVTVASTGGDIVFASTLDGPHALVANAAGALAFNDAVGSTTALTGLTTNSTTFSAANTLDIDGNLSVTTTVGAIEQAGAFKVTGTARFDAGNQAIRLENGDNAFGGAVSLATTGAADMVLVDHGPLLLGNVSTGTGQLSLTSLGGGISQQDGTAIVQAAGAGVTELKATGAVDLSSAGNDFTGALDVTGTSVSIKDMNDLAVSYLDSTAGADVSLIAGGELALTGDIDTGGGDLTLASDGGVLAPVGNLSGGNVSLRGRDGVSLAHDVIATGTLGLASADGPIMQTGGVLDVAGASTIDAGTGAIALTRAGNDFGGAVSLAGGATQIIDSNALTLGTLATGDLTATSTGTLNLGSGTVDGMLTASSNNAAVMQGGGLAVSGTSSIDAGTGAITLADTGNDFGGAVSLAGGVTRITDKNMLALGTLATGDLAATSNGALNLGKGVVSGNLTANSHGGAIGQNGALTVAGTSGINAGTGVITLANAGNDFAGTVDLTGGNTRITDTNTLTLGALDTGDLTANSTGTLNLGAGTVDGLLTAYSHGGAIGQTGPLNVTGAGAIDAAGATITLIDADNDFAGPVSLAGGVTQITDKNALALGTLATGDLSATSTGALNLGKGVVTGNLTANSHDGAIGQSGALTVVGTSGINAGTGAITLADAGNDFAGTVDLTGGDTRITDTNTLTLGALDTGDLTANSTGTLNLGAGTVDGLLTAYSHGGAIGQSGPLNVTGAGAIDAAGGTITLINADNDFVGPVSLAGGVTQITDTNALALGTLATGDLTATSSGALNLGKGAVGGNLTADSHDGAIGQSGALTVAGTSGINAGTGAITLANAGNDFAGTVDLTGGDTRITDTNTLTLGALDTGDLTANSTGTLNLGAGTVDGLLTAHSHGGAIGQSGPLNVTGAGAIDAAGGTITLIDADNDFVGAVSLAGGVTQITDKNALALGTLATGDLSATSTGALNLGKGVVTGNLTADSHGGAISQSGALTVTGTSGINAGTGAITLADAGNDFQGSVNLAGKGITVNDATGLTIGTLANAANSSVSLSAGDSLILPAAAIATGTGDLLLAARHGTLATPGALSGANVSLSGGDGLDLVHDVSASGTLTLASASGDIKQTAGTLTAHTLAGNAGGSTTLGQANAIDRLGNFAANGLILVDSSALAVIGPVDGGAGAVLIHSDGMLSVAGGIKGAQVALQGAGGIRQSSGAIDAGTGQVILASDAGIVQTGGSIAAGTLVGSANGDASLASANRVDRLGGFSAGNFSMNNGQALAVNGPLNVTGDIAIATTTGKLSLNTDLAGADVSLSAGGDLVLGADLAGDSVVLRSGGTISQGSGNTITANRLSGQSSGTTTLDQANAIGALGDFRANGLSLTSTRALAIDGTVDGGGRTRLTVGGDLAIAGTLAGDATSLAVAGAISESVGGGITAHTLDGHATGAASLTGANRVDTLGAFTAAGFALSNGPTLTVTGPLDGGASVSLATTRGDLLINGKVTGKTTVLVSAGAITEGQGGSITADTLSGHAGGATRLGTATSPLANYIGTLGGFSSPAGFSLTNAQTLTLASVGGSSYTVDAGTSALYLGVTGGDLLQADKTWLYDGEGAFSSTGRIGTADAPIYVTGTGAQAVAMVGLPPAYFYALNRKGNLLPLTGGSSVNVPTSLFTSRAQNANNHTDVYIDPSVISANYRSFGIVPSGILLPPDQQACDPELEECDE